MPYTIAPTAVNDITRFNLQTPAALEAFGSTLLTCCVENKELFDLANICVNYDTYTGKNSRNDFLNPLETLIFSGMQAFASCWYPGNPWPVTTVDWAVAIVPHFDLFFDRNPEFPQLYKVEATKKLIAVQSSLMGDYDRVCDGLIDYLLGVRYHLLEQRSKTFDPARRREELDSIPKSIRIPGAAVPDYSSRQSLAEIFAKANAIKPFLTGVRGFDHHYGSKAQGGDAWLFFGHPGGGKTNAGCQTAAFTAASGKLAMYVTTEVKKPTILLRMCSAQLGLSYSLLKGLLGNDGHPMASTFSRWMEEGPGQNVAVYDYRDAPGKDYKDKFNRLLESFYRTHGRAPDLVVWDWIGKALDSGFPSAWDKREAYSAVASMLVDKADELDNATLTLAQADKDCKNKTNLHESNTADCRNLCDGMEGVCGITSLVELAENNAQEQECHKAHQYWIICKCREELALRLPVARCFDKARFETPS